MGESADSGLLVSIRELPPVHAAGLDYQMNGAAGDSGPAIRQCFQRVQAWVRELGYDPYALLNIGVIHESGGQLSSYGCCVQVPEDVRVGSAGVEIRELSGGRYAVVSIVKDPAIIGESIGRFYQEYAPRNNVEIDGARPTYEIYYERMMEYCVPVRSLGADG